MPALPGAPEDAFTGQYFPLPWGAGIGGNGRMRCTSRTRQLLLLTIMVALPLTALRGQAANRQYRYHDLMPAYWRVMRASSSAADATRVTRFRASVVTPN